MTVHPTIQVPVPLFENLELIEHRISSASRLALLLDFDGTLSPIVPNPDDAQIDPEVYATLQALSTRPDFNIGIVSGRALSDVRKRVDLKGAIYVGNHGLEIETESVCFRQPEAESLRRELKCLYLQLKLALSDTEGLEIEDKGVTLSVHFRRVPPEMHDWIRSVTFSTVARWHSFVCREGKMVLDIRPQLGWDKGRAVKYIMHELLPASALPVYVGDDVTDEDAFAAIPEGITIKVGGLAESEAQFLLPDVAAVRHFLQWLDHAKPHASLANFQRAGR
jgi:trehalose 6-phosphate phosphatase